MTIQGGKIYDILRTYNKQVKYSKASSSEKSSPDKNIDKVIISSDARKLSFISSLMAEIGKSDKETLQKIDSFTQDVDFGSVSEEDLAELKQNILKTL
ncbi:hypothetical protein LF845_02810 [Deferribacterales bacterium Es71-Z0220]|jgi:hypothetical protein|uniref:hypothetical protein n=1 Tax=Deferrivibrio essentukiensis TaxID=2880922 RepID=UPI001F60C026|nr:hypothetical protein [Deferrivibrio essentukiensis]MCB4203890.1 hypothetical protein [Deferrivibrio essentukiensis]